MSQTQSTLAILFADISGSTRLYETLGDHAALAAIDGCIEALKAVTAQCNGRSVKTIGDELMAVFPDADAAALAAREMHWRVLDLAPAGNEPLAIKVGFHFGPAVEQDDDVFGDAVNVASRLAGLAKRSQIVTSGETLAQLSPAFRNDSRRIANLVLKGKSTDVAIHELVWRDSDDLTVTMNSQFAPPPVATRLRLLHAGAELVVGPERPSVTLGREPQNDLSVPDKNASRVHARIEWRGGKFVLIDQSTNGTYVRNERDGEIRLHLEEMVLHGNGTIAFGRSVQVENRGRVEYYCEMGRRAA